VIHLSPTEKKPFQHFVRFFRLFLLRRSKSCRAKDNRRLTKEIAYEGAAAALKDRIKQAPFREEARKLLESIVPDVPPLEEDKITSA
jgi:hypothetical protein